MGVDVHYGRSSRGHVDEIIRSRLTQCNGFRRENEYEVVRETSTSSVRKVFYMQVQMSRKHDLGDTRPLTVYLPRAR